MSDEAPAETEVEAPPGDGGGGGAASQVAAHYNGLPACNFSARRASPIFRLRNFNNWIKSQAIAEACERAGIGNGGGAALDLCCGRGGDLFKWRTAGLRRLVCADIAEESVAECERKFRSARMFGTRAAFVAADCADPRRPLRALHALAAEPVDVVSCQFALHYSFESLPRARAMMENATRTLRPGGIFVGTLPDAYEIVARARASPSPDGSFGNSIYRVTPHQDTFPLDRAPPLFGAKYDFRLEGVVDCPEFLVHFPALEALARAAGLETVARANFRDYFEARRRPGAELLRKMEGLETVWQRDLEKSEKGEGGAFKHCEAHFGEHGADKPVGTMSRDEWEATTMYCVFMFRKKCEAPP